MAAPGFRRRGLSELTHVLLACPRSEPAAPDGGSVLGSVEPRAEAVHVLRRVQAEDVALIDVLEDTVSTSVLAQRSEPAVGDGRCVHVEECFQHRGGDDPVVAADAGQHTVHVLTPVVDDGFELLVR